MATKSVLKNSASALLALLLGTAALIPATASAQERVDRGERGAGRMQRMERPAPPPVQAQVQAQVQAPRAPVMNPPSGGGWQGRPAWSSNGSQPARPAPPANPNGSQGGWQGRQAWQNGGGGDRERGDRGNGVYPNGQPTFGRPAWSGNGGQVPQARPAPPAWGTRNPTYVDPNRANTGWQGNNANDRNRGDRDGQRNGQRDWQNNRGNNWQGGDDRWRGNRSWQGNNGWRGNGWGYNNGGRGWDRNGWRRNNRYNWYGWRNSHRSTFSLGLYYAPWQGYSYSRFGIGAVIGAPFYDQRYWIADPWAFRLPPADGPYRWVRYYDDALLIDIYSGEVVDVIYDIFW